MAMNTWLLFFLIVIRAVNGIVPTSVKNFRAVLPGIIYRSATLDNLSVQDADFLLSGSAFGIDSRPVAAVIDLRNHDEILKGKTSRTDGSNYFYTSLDDRAMHIPILRDVDSFWDEAISRMDPLDRMKATLETAFNGGALDRAAARHLERGGLPLLYTIMMVASGRSLATALHACVEASTEGTVIFNCQKGKDRTGVLAMLIQNCLGEDEANIIEAYAMSGELLDEKQTANRSSDDSNNGTSIDWSYFRGSPANAMEETLNWIRQRYGSVEAYLDIIAFDSQKRSRLQQNCKDFFK
eukprot:CAMPEP_0113320486 /NCGR_PEP_ID=MMETSP0010_2-20120614/14290_1 /TAXON_ID=216773 ORGANISM="Corethron hystrix, Strain 308" /NCGR_SAMPLE_ID=MMETSP0010_2 /ASSEMBLY_ACC=CAM_ASM_000155 /LENGTH=295 /DNA_ID=CAMNT_0000178307 /DNA_START=154 /DNA_END=1041 /DNA_ORIENTATION=- /assembly_acc=CAM_ASM_000155